MLHLPARFGPCLRARRGRDVLGRHWDSYDLAVWDVSRVNEDHVVLHGNLLQLLHALGADEALDGRDTMVVRRLGLGAARTVLLSILRLPVGVLGLCDALLRVSALVLVVERGGHALDSFLSLWMA